MAEESSPGSPEQPADRLALAPTIQGLCVHLLCAVDIDDLTQAVVVWIQPVQLRLTHTPSAHVVGHRSANTTQTMCRWGVAASNLIESV